VLAGLHAASARSGRAAEVAVLIAANLAATVVRFGLYRGWVFRSGAPVAAPARGRETTPVRPAPDYRANPDRS